MFCTQEEIFTKVVTLPVLQICGGGGGDGVVHCKIIFLSLKRQSLHHGK